MVNVGDIVFAKIRGYPYWPAKIVNINNITSKCDVIFYGPAKDTASTSANDLLPYDENKNKYGLPKTDNNKNKSFNMAIREAEEDKGILNYEGELINNITNISKEIEEKVEEVRNLEDPNDLETSICLAAEIGNVLLKENANLKRELQTMTLMYSQIKQQLAEYSSSSDMLILEARRDELENDNAILLHRNLILSNELKEAELQLEKEKMLRADLTQLYQDQDKETELELSKSCRVNKCLREEIVLLQNVIGDRNKNQLTESSPKDNTETYRDNPSECFLNNSVVLEIAQLKTNHKELEITVKAIQDQLLKQNVHSVNLKSSEYSPSKTKTTNYIMQNNIKGRNRSVSKMKVKNVYSKSLQMRKARKHSGMVLKKSKVDFKQQSIKRGETTGIGKKSLVDGVFSENKILKLKGVPPISAKKLKKGETIEEFYLNNIENLTIDNMDLNSQIMDCTPAVAEPTIELLDLSHNQIEDGNLDALRMRDNLTQTFLGHGHGERGKRNYIHPTRWFHSSR